MGDEANNDGGGAVNIPVPHQGPTAAMSSSGSGAAATQMQAAAPAAGAGLTADDVKRIVGDSFKQFSEKTAASAKAIAARQAVITNDLKGVPDMYHGMLPDTDNAEALREAGKKIVAQVNKDFDSMLRSHPRYAEIKQTWENFGGGGRSGGTVNGNTNPTPDRSKMTPADLVSEGLKQSKAAAAAI